MTSENLDQWWWWWPISLTLICVTPPPYVNILWPMRNGRQFPDDIFKYIFLNENVRILLKISLMFVPNVPIDYNQTLVQIMAWHRSGDKPSFKPMMISLLGHLQVIRPQWIKKPHSMSDGRGGYPIIHELIYPPKTSDGVGGGVSYDSWIDLSPKTGLSMKNASVCPRLYQHAIKLWKYYSSYLQIQGKCNPKLAESDKWILTDYVESSHLNWIFQGRCGINFVMLSANLSASQNTLIFRWCQISVSIGNPMIRFRLVNESTPGCQMIYQPNVPGVNAAYSNSNQYRGMKICQYEIGSVGFGKKWNECTDSSECVQV